MTFPSAGKWFYSSTFDFHDGGRISGRGPYPPAPADESRQLSLFKDAPFNFGDVHRKAASWTSTSRSRTHAMNTHQHDLLQTHSLTFLEMAFRTDRQGVIAHPDGYGKKTGDCGDSIEIFLSIGNGRIEQFRYQLDGCLNTNACCNTLGEMTEGQTTAAAWEITPEKVAAHLQTLPPDHFHCAELAVGTLYLALISYREVRQAPWKKLYR
jgi:nitrogen fixation NifU-like protein